MVKVDFVDNRLLTVVFFNYREVTLTWSLVAPRLETVTLNLIRPQNLPTLLRTFMK